MTANRVRFERIAPVHRLLGLVIGFIGAMILAEGSDEATGLAWGAALLLSGLVLAFARGGNVIDFEAKQVIAYLGWIVPWSRERRPFSSLRVVSVEGRKRSQNSIGSVYEFPVELRGEGPDVRLCEPNAYAKARRLARQLAHRMGLGLSDHGVERPSGFADEPLRDRLLRTGAIPGQETVDPSDPYRTVTASRKPPAPPAGTAITVEDGEQETRIVVPARFRLSWWLLPLGVTLLVGGIPLMAQGATAFAIELAAGFWSLTGIGVWLCVWNALRPSRIVIDSRGVQARCFFPMMELDDVHVATAEEPRYHDLTSRMSHPKRWPFVVVRSDKRAVAVGVGRSPEELAWLVARIQHAIARHSTETRARV